MVTWTKNHLWVGADNSGVLFHWAIPLVLNSSPFKLVLSSFKLYQSNTKKLHSFPAPFQTAFRLVIKTFSVRTQTILSVRKTLITFTTFGLRTLILKVKRQAMECEELFIIHKPKKQKTKKPWIQNTTFFLCIIRKNVSNSIKKEGRMFNNH